MLMMCAGPMFQLTKETGTTKKRVKKKIVNNRSLDGGRGGGQDSLRFLLLNMSQLFPSSQLYLF